MNLADRAVYAQGLDLLYTVQDIEDVFRDCGHVVKVFPRLDSKDAFTGTAFVLFEDSRDAGYAVSVMYDEGSNLEVMSLTKSQSRELACLVGEAEQDDLVTRLLAGMTPQVKQKIKRRLDFSEPIPRSANASQRSFGPQGDHGNQSYTQYPQHTQYDQHPHVLIKDPKLSCFSGLKSKDTPFGRWKYEVKCLNTDKNYSANTILSAVRKSLRSPAADVVSRLGEYATLEGIMAKFESIYGTVMSGEAILEKFYSARQKPKEENEDCAMWCCRLEELIYQALEKEAVHEEEIGNMLRNRFWSGLRESRIKDALRQHRRNMSVEDMVKEARTLEEEFEIVACKEEKTHKAKAHVSAVAASTTEESKLDKILERLAQLEIEVAQSRSQGGQQRFSGRQDGGMRSHGPVKCHICKEEGHLAYGCRQGMSVNCFKCKKEGHISKACRAEGLNGIEPR